MQQPGIVASELGDGEAVAAEVSLGGDDRLLVTPDRSIVYRAGGVLSDESVTSLPHGVTRLTVSEGRRKATLTFEYPIEPDREVAVPLDHLEAVLQPLLAAVMRESGATDPGERVHRVFSFSELTLVITDERLFKHVGAVLWDADHESIPYDAVTGLDYEEGSVATGIVFTVDGRKERVKTPNDRLPEVRQHLESALVAARDLDSIDDLADDSDDATADAGAVADFGGVDPLDAGETAPRDAVDGEPGDDGAHGVEGDETASDDGTDPDTRDGADADAPDAAGDDAGADAADTGGDADAADEDGADSEPDDDADAGPDDGDDPLTDDDTVSSETSTTDGMDEDDANEDSAPAAGDGDDATPFTESFRPAGEESVGEELSELRAAVEQQNELLRRHNEAIERLVETLRED